MVCVQVSLFLGFGTLGKTNLSAHATETDIGALLILIFPHTDIGADIMSDVLPGASAHNLALHLIGVLDGGIVTIFGIQVVGKLAHAFSVGRRGPFADVDRPGQSCLPAV